MLDNLAVNVSSLKLVEGELNNEIKQTGGHFEGFLLERGVISHLEECKSRIAQISGTIRLLEVPGALQLVDEMLALVTMMIDKQDMISDHNLSALSNAFVALPCYLEHITARGYAMPVLTLKYINELRAARYVELISESQYFGLEVDVTTAAPEFPDQVVTEDFVSLVRRLRHMYQVGLLGVIREDNIGVKISLLQRSVDRMKKASGNSPLAELWWLTAAVLESLASGQLKLTLYRKRILAIIDRYFKKAVYDGESALEQSVDENFKKELLFLIAISKELGEQGNAIKAHYALSEPSYTDGDLVKEQSLMQGPNAATVQSMVAVLKEELASAKDVLEMAAQGASEFVDFEPLLETLQRIADILVVVGVKAISGFLTEQIERVKQWQTDSEIVDQQGLLEMADAFLYVESTLTGLDRMDLSEDDIREASEMVKQKFIAKSHLAEAEVQVVKEAQAGISLTKRAISSFIESQYDTVHIANVASTLNSIKGGMLVLGLSRAANILNSCMSFVDNMANQVVDEAKMEEVLETLADALVSLEYYLSEVANHSNADEKVLEVAEESLRSLGYPVNQ